MNKRLLQRDILRQFPASRLPQDRILSPQAELYAFGMEIALVVEVIWAAHLVGNLLVLLQELFALGGI